MLYYLFWRKIEFFRRKRIFLVLENDVLFTQQNLNYWLKNRETLRHSRLVPSFLRIEYSQNLGDWICIDIHGMNSLKERILRKIADNLVLQIPSLYSGLIVLDDELLVEYVESKAIDKLQSKELIWWDLGARASMGIQFVNIPQYFSDRHVIPLYQPLNLEVPKEALVHHLPNLYSSVPELANRYPTLDRVNRQLETWDKSESTWRVLGIVLEIRNYCWGTSPICPFCPLTATNSHPIRRGG